MPCAGTPSGMAWRRTLVIAKSDLGGDERGGGRGARYFFFVCPFSCFSCASEEREGAVYFLGLLPWYVQ